MTAKYSIDGEIDLGWRSYWPPEEQPSDESAESDTDASDREPTTDTETMSDTADSEPHDDELPVYATEPEQGEITTEGEPMTDLEREIKAVADDLGEYRSETKPNDRKAIALTRLNPELSAHELAEQFDLGDSQSIRQANLKMEHATLETQSDIKDALSELSDRQYAVVEEKARDPSQKKTEIARTLDIPNGTATTYANRFGVLAAKARDFGISFDRDANIESANYTEPGKNQAAVRDAVENADEPLTASAIGERASVATRSTRRHLNLLTEDGILTELPPDTENRAKRWSSDDHPLVLEDDSSAPTDEDAQKLSEENTPSDPKTVDVGFRLGRETYHVLNDDDEACCNLADTSDDRESAAFIRTVEADVADEFDRCKRCARVLESDKRTRDELVQDILDALDTGRESTTFTKVELLRILEAVDAYWTDE